MSSANDSFKDNTDTSSLELSQEGATHGGNGPFYIGSFGDLEKSKNIVA